MDGKIYSRLSVALLALLILSIIPGVAVRFIAAESLSTDRPLYAIKWKDNVLGYVNVTVILTGLSPETRYEVAVFKHHGPAGLNYVKEVYGVYEAEIKFTIPPTMDSRPEDIAGTWNATLYKIVGETRSIVTWVNFGVWAINSKVLNYGRILQVWGGGFKPDTRVNFTVYNAGEIITDELFGEDPARSPVSGVVCVKYGTFSNTSDIITTEIPEATYTIELIEFEFLPRVTSLGEPETTLEFTITHELIVNILKPADGSKWRRTDTVPVEVEVLYQDLVPVTSGEVNVTFTPPSCGKPPYDSPKIISLSYSPISKTWVGSFKIQKDNATGGDWPTPANWIVSADAEDFYGNSGSDSNEIIVKAAILVVSTEVAPPSSIPRASWVSWLIKVTYKGDGSPAKLDIPLCTIYIVNATTNATVGSAYLVEVEVGRYNVTWFVPPDAPLGDYRFLIPAYALKDTVTVCGVRNTGPENDVLSPIFAVGITKLMVEVKTYSAKHDTTKERVAFTPGSTVYIGAKVTYIESGVVMTAGTVRAYIYNETGYLIAPEIPMKYDSVTRMWWCEWDSTGYPAGRYRVLVKARDIGYNVGEGETYFYISGLVVSPSKGTVPPIENTKCEKLKDGNWLITASVYTDPVSGKSLGTVISISAAHFTPNSKVNITVDWLPYPDLSGNILLYMNIPTDAEGNFATSIVFPTTIKGIYYIIARDAKGLEMKATFEVIPGMILTPDPVVGSALIKVIATGLPGPVEDFTSAAEAWEILVNDTDAFRTLALHVGFIPGWETNANGTLVSPDLSEAYSYSVKPGFIMPFIEPGAYTFKLILEGGGYRNSTDPALFKVAKITSVSDSVRVVNAFKEFTTLVDKVDDLIELVTAMNVKLTSVDRNVATLVTDTGTIKADISALKTLIERMGGTLTDISGGVATIKTSVGEIKASVDALSPKIEAVSGDVAKISTSIGEITANLEAIEPVITSIRDGVATVSTKIDTLTGKVTTIDGNVATVRTDVGEVKATIANLAGVPGAVSTVTMAVWIAVILSLIAAICSIVSLVQLRKKIAG